MPPVVETRCGRVEGVDEGGIASFRGIPFAKPPLGPLRFRAPEPPEPWSGVRPAGGFGPSPLQTKIQFDALGDLGVGEQSEDCLYLNVYTPGADGGRRPVMVWIHGGAFVLGSGSQGAYDARGLARRGDAVLVTLNYRVGALGFLQLEGLARRESTPNAGLLDQVAALAWVRDNVAAFGGDPSHVTVFGESAGGASVATLLAMPAARGLFRRAIAQSGSVGLCFRPEEATRAARVFLEELGVEPGDDDALWRAEPDDLLSAQERCMRRVDRAGENRSFRPTIDGRVIPDAPLRRIRAGHARDVSLMIGATRDEWKLFGLMDPQVSKLDEAALLERMQARVPGRGRQLVEAYRRARRGRAPTTPPELYFALETDRIFRIPSVLAAEAQSRHRRDTYAYLVTWESPLLDGALGACHGLDVPFLFGSANTAGGRLFTGGGPEAERMSDRIQEAWLGFARTGDPNHPGLPEWPPYDAQRRATMILDRECRVEDAPLDAERRAWEDEAGAEPA